MKLIIGNKNYSSWSLRGWLAAKQSGLSFEELTVNIDGDDWQAMKVSQGEFQPSAGKVPVLWDSTVVVWDSLVMATPERVTLSMTVRLKSCIIGVLIMI